MSEHSTRPLRGLGPTPRSRRRCAVAAPNDLAAEAALEMAAAGGNAVDCAIASVLVALVSEPGVSSLGGGVYLTVTGPDGANPVVIDGGVAMPGVRAQRAHSIRATGSTREVVLGFADGTAFSVGHGSVATPGTISALTTAHALYGELPWAAVCEPAVQAADSGALLGPTAGAYLVHSREPVFGWHPEVAAVWHRLGRELGVGDRVRIPGLGDFIRLLAKKGAAAFYRGEVAHSLAEDMARNGGLVTVADLATYRAQVRAALPFRFGPWQGGTVPKPLPGGTALLALLRVGLGQSPAIEPTVAQRWALSLGGQLRLAHARAGLRPAGERSQDAAEPHFEAVRQHQAGRSRSASTVQVSVVDDLGRACCLTATFGYGSGVPVPGTGIWLNNALGESDLQPADVMALPPGLRLATNMAPTVVRHEDGSVLAVGSPGSERITGAIAAVLVPVLSRTSSGVLTAPWLRAVVERPRMHVRRTGLPHRAVVDYEVDVGTAASLAFQRLWPGPVTWNERPAHDLYFGATTTAVRTAAGELLAVADPRRHQVAGVSQPETPGLRAVGAR